MKNAPAQLDLDKEEYLFKEKVEFLSAKLRNRLAGRFENQLQTEEVLPGLLPSDFHLSNGEIDYEFFADITQLLSLLMGSGISGDEYRKITKKTWQNHFENHPMQFVLITEQNELQILNNPHHPSAIFQPCSPDANRYWELCPNDHSGLKMSDGPSSGGYYGNFYIRIYPYAEVSSIQKNSTTNPYELLLLKPIADAGLPLQYHHRRKLMDLLSSPS